MRKFTRIIKIYIFFSQVYTYINYNISQTIHHCFLAMQWRDFPIFRKPAYS